MRFAYPWVAWLTPLVVLAVAALELWVRRRRSGAIAGFAGTGSPSWANPGISPVRQRMDLVFSLAAVGFLGATLARPMFYRQDSQSELQGVPYMVALDVSRSMLATDVAPSRFAAATNLLDRFFADTVADRVGLIGFAGVAYLHAPLTFDMGALRTILRYVQPEDYIDPGSSISTAMDRAGRYFVSNGVPQRVLLVVSDGEDLEGRPVETARRWYRDAGMKICTLGVGTAAGGKVPMNRSGTAVATNTFGQQITTRLNESNLQRIANAAGGRYYRLGENGEGLRALRKEFLAPLAEAVARENLRNYTELFQIPLCLALAAMVGRILAGADRFRVRRPLPAIWRGPSSAVSKADS